MKQKLLLYALISCPIFALYAISHPLIFGIVTYRLLLGPLIGLTLNIFIIWIINIYIFVRFQRYSIWKRAAISYGGIFLFQCCFAIINSVVLIKDEMAPFRNFYLHPIITSIVINVVILIICNSTEAFYKKNTAELKAKDLELENSEARKKLLVQQLQPHFLFNALSVLKSLIRENPAGAENYTLKLSDFLRYSVQSHQNELVSLTEELNFVNDFVELQRVRFEDCFAYVTKIPSNVLQQKIPVFALQTLVENAFKHNYFTEQKPLIIKVIHENGSLVVWNNKTSVRLTDRTQTGLKNLQRRYELTIGKSIEIMDTDDSFSIKIPLI